MNTFVDEKEDFIQRGFQYQHLLPTQQHNRSLTSLQEQANSPDKKKRPIIKGPMLAHVYRHPLPLQRKGPQDG